MARTNAAMFAFNRGEVSKAALARVDNERLRLAAECQLNWLPNVIGDMTLRTGLQMINEVYQDAAGEMIPFIFSKTDTAIIELTPNILRIEVAGSLVTRAAVSATVADPNFSGGGYWTIANTTYGATATVGGGQCDLIALAVGSLAQVQQVISIPAGDYGIEHALRVVVANGPVTLRAGSAAGLSDMIAQTSIDTGTHSLVFTPFQASVYLQIETSDPRQKSLTQCSMEGPGVMTLPTPWGASALNSLRFDQSGDIVYCAAYGLQPYTIERRAAHGWSVVLWRPKIGPFSTVSDGTVSLSYPSGLGNGTMTASRPFFAPGCEEQLIQLFALGQYYGLYLAGQAAYSPAVRVNGVGDTRNYSWTIAGTWSGTLSFQRSFDGADTGVVTVQT